jgi:hypothetical protein
MQTTLEFAGLLVGIFIVTAILEDKIVLWSLIGGGASLLALYAYFPTAFDFAVASAEGGAALAWVIFVWVSPFVVIWIFVSLVIKAFASATASEIERRRERR